MIYFFAHPFISLSIGFGIVFLALAWSVYGLYRRWRKIFGTSQPEGPAAGEALRRIAETEQRLTALEPRIQALESIGSIAIQKVGFMRFNPFEHTGGDQSFAMALLDHGDNGIVLSSLYTREGVRVYAKEIRHGAPKHPLSDEEQKVLEQAIHKES